MIYAFLLYQFRPESVPVSIGILKEILDFCTSFNRDIQISLFYFAKYISGHGIYIISPPLADIKRHILAKQLPLMLFSGNRVYASQSSA